MRNLVLSWNIVISYVSNSLSAECSDSYMHHCRGCLQIVRTVRAIPRPVEVSRPVQPLQLLRPREHASMAAQVVQHGMYLMDRDDWTMSGDDDDSSYYDDDSCSIT